jgi:hypothetical protein
MAVDPAALRQIAAQLQAGVVLRLHSPIAEKPKRHVMIYADANRSLAFMINTKPPPFIAKNPDRLARQVLMPQCLHKFMQHDSHITGDDVLGIACRKDGLTGTMQDLIQAVADGRVEILGNLHRSLFGLVAAAADGSRHIANRDAVLIAAAFKI